MAARFIADCSNCGNEIPQTMPSNMHTIKCESCGYISDSRREFIIVMKKPTTKGDD